ncbi:uncharacterized protein RSE6_09719 [Rhynchosporium secalis]|uniref:BTB domain-containing protein n=1 Tax=Rhynchosporium secalis TaxID=38038 RepID=A0A1E1MIM1_RHYSE|nr:uncharacterized protein RSE6_09719 [Rhynchosporium secalis]
MNRYKLSDLHRLSESKASLQAPGSSPRFVVIPSKASPQILKRKMTVEEYMDSRESVQMPRPESVQETSARSATDIADVVNDVFLIHELIKSGKMVKVYVGPEKHCWEIHEDAICHQSPYFEKAFRGGFKESAQKSINLEDEDSDVFGLFVHWIYTSSLRCNKCTNPSRMVDPEEHFMQYLRLETFADKYLISGLSRFVIAQWIKCHRVAIYRPFKKEIDYIYENFPEKSLFRAEVVAQVLLHYLTVVDDSDHIYMGFLLAANRSFAEVFSSQLRSHLIKKAEDCEIEYCCAHKVLCT